MAYGRGRERVAAVGGGTFNTPHVVNKPKDWATARAKGNGNGSATRIKRQLTEIVHATLGHWGEFFLLLLLLFLLADFHSVSHSLSPVKRQMCRG